MRQSQHRTFRTALAVSAAAVLASAAAAHAGDPFYRPKYPTYPGYAKPLTVTISAVPKIYVPPRPIEQQAYHNALSANLGGVFNPVFVLPVQPNPVFVPVAVPVAAPVFQPVGPVARNPFRVPFLPGGCVQQPCVAPPVPAPLPANPLAGPPLFPLPGLNAQPGGLGLF